MPSSYSVHIASIYAQLKNVTKVRSLITAERNYKLFSVKEENGCIMCGRQKLEELTPVER